MACALGRVQLRRLSEFLELRANAAHRYDHLLRGIASVDRPLLTLENATISWFVYVVRLPAAVDRDRVQAIMAQDGIATGRYFPPIHLQPAWSARGHGPAVHLPVTEAIARRTLALPFFNRITLEQQERVANSLKKAIAVL
jgi:perosamine synthetase